MGVVIERRRLKTELDGLRYRGLCGGREARSRAPWMDPREHFVATERLEATEVLNLLADREVSGEVVVRV